MKGFVLVFLVAMVTTVVAVGTGGQCSTDADCTVTNTYSSCAILFTSASCGGTGFCTCNTGYTGNSCVPEKKKHGQTCSANTDCDTGLTCDNNACACATSTYTYRSSVMLCLSTSMKAYGETCSAPSECFNDGNPGMTCSNTCQCLAGYIPKEGLCFKPYYGQTCTSAVGCTIDGETLLMPDTSRQTETCQSEVCRCPSTAEVAQYERPGDITRSVCLERVDSSVTLKADGQTCTVSNECSSKLCSTCLDGTTTKKCVRFVSGVSGLETSIKLLSVFCVFFYLIL